MHIGVDVGGTNTDAVLLDGTDVLAFVKSPTTDDVGSGVVSAIKTILAQSGTDAARIESVMIGTTQFTNAFVEGKKLVPVAVFRAALPATESVRPMVEFPDHLTRQIGTQSYLVNGGYEFDGRIIAPLDEKAVAAGAKDMKAKGIKSAVLSGVFTPINSAMEDRMAEIILNEAPDTVLTASGEIGRIGLIERENAAIMNASLCDLSHMVVSAFRDALRELNIICPLFVSQNDGTLMTAEFAEKYPVLTFASGPTNSMRGAAFLSGESDAIVADIGGTTTDTGVLIGGFPRESAISVDIGAVRTNFRMPDVLAVGLGGGSHVRDDGNRIGPDSVALDLLTEAMVFGGQTLTTTDIAVAAGYADVGDPSFVKHLDKALVNRAVDRMHAMVEEATDRVKSTQGEVPVILVGGGSVLINRDIRGASQVIRPEKSGVANAIGAALAQVGGEVDKVFSYDKIGREEAMEEARQSAIERAVDAGASADTTKIVSLEEMPLTYLPAGAVRIKVKAIGDLAPAGDAS
ncbi:hydantoinase [Phaeobacter inhibens]|uniref:hydantoinase/oxoprolinase family protein n=1 Tax=Phaeobacter inhibens TaxID=221822 RepID=UPI00274D7337|nr:hydantoinase/oxoprolinase family protein [Phaeobacter inhibens]GLO68504.1 hydantoinase [Phaeobacter inhibens]